MAHALFLADEVRTGRRRIGQSLVTDADVAAHAAGQIDDDVDLALADALDDFAVVARLHAEDPALRVAHVDMHDGGAGMRRVDRRLRDLLRSHRAVRALRELGVIAGDGAGDEDV